MPEDKELDRQGMNKQELDELAELEVGDRVRAEAEEEGGWDDVSGEREEGEQDAETPVSAPTPIAPPVSVPIPVAPVLRRTGETLWGGDQPKPRYHSELDDLFVVPQEEDNDIYVDDLFELDDEEDLDLDDDLSDLTQVTREDVMGVPPKPKPKFRRTGRPYSPPSSLGGTR